MMDILHQIAQVLLDQWLFDVAVFSNVWMYIPFFIPVIFYLMFFMLKWTFLTLPVWLPIFIILAARK